MDILTALVPVIAVSTTAIAIVINFLSESQKRKHEKELFFVQNYYKDCTETFSNLLNSLGQLLVDNTTDAKLLEVLPLIYQSCIYADERLLSSLKNLYTQLEIWNKDFDNEELNDKCQQCVFLVSEDINYFLSKNFNKKIK
jgi:hypothetical protein